MPTMSKQTEETQEQVREALKGKDKYPYSDISDTYGYIVQKADADFLKLCLESKPQEEKTF